MNVQRLAAFACGSVGGNPAGVVLAETLPGPTAMQALAAQVGYSETVFAAPEDDGWRVRYFAPAIEIPFCGHATIALGAALAAEHGDGTYKLHLNTGSIEVEGRRAADQFAAVLQSPPTKSQPAPADVIAAALGLFNLSSADLDPLLPVAFVEAGARHLLIALRSRELLAQMNYDFETGAKLMSGWGLATATLVHAETPMLFHARNPFAAGGVYEDPATGAAAAALAGYLKELDWEHSGSIEIRQGDDMGIPCRLFADIPVVKGGSVRVSGSARYM